MPTTITPNMSLVLPGVGTQAGPQYATDVNNSLSIIDTHDHTPGNGVLIPTAGINIDNTLSFNTFGASDLQRLSLNAQGSPLSGTTYPTSLYASGVDLYYNDGSGNQIQITASGQVNTATGNITGLVAPALAAYLSGPLKFLWQANSTTSLPAIMDCGSVIIREDIAAGFGITLRAPTGLASPYSTTLPAAPPSVTRAVLMDNTGTLSTATENTFMPAGVVLPYAGTSLPSGYLFCDGSAVSRTTYAGLFAAIGTTAGNGDGTTTFNLPDYRGRFMRGVDGAAGRDPDSSSRTAMNVGGNTGNNISSVQNSVFLSHNHGGGNHNHVYNVGTSIGFTGAQATYERATSASNQLLTNSSGNIINSEGGNETRPINAYVNYIIKF